MRLPTGEVEVATATALEAAFRCGLVDVHTPVRSMSSPVWTTLGELAELDQSDPSLFRARTGHVVRTGVALLGLLAIIVFGGTQLAPRTASAETSAVRPRPPTMDAGRAGRAVTDRHELYRAPPRARANPPLVPKQPRAPMRSTTGANIGQHHI